MVVVWRGEEVNLNDNKAFLLIETRVGRATEAVSALKQLEGVKSADTVTGSMMLLLS